MQKKTYKPRLTRTFSSQRTPRTRRGRNSLLFTSAPSVHSALKNRFRINQHPILTFTKGRLVKFYFEDKEMEGYEDEPIAAALIANGVKVFRITEKMKRPRGFFCAVGKCSSCLMTVDSKPNVMVCVESLKEGMKVERQIGRGKLSD